MPISKFLLDYSLDFKNTELVKTAMTHSSYTHQAGLQLSECNERLEFLGDAVLKISISSFLFDKFPDAQEGELTKLHSEIVSNKTLANFAKRLGLGELLILGAQEEKAGGRKKASILACALEALLGAIFLEFGLERVKKFLLDNFEEDILNIQLSNYKALLQEYTQGQDSQLPEYRLLHEDGEAHKKTFEMGVYYNSELLAKGRGHSKKEAQQEAAKAALEKLEILKSEISEQ